MFGSAQKDHKEAKASVDHSLILKRLEQIEDWYHVYGDDILKNKVLNTLPRMKEAFEDLKVLKDIETSVFERIIDYLKEKGEVKEYDVEEIKEKYLVIDWIACQLCFRRPIKTKQLFIYGELSTQKTLLIHFGITRDVPLLYNNCKAVIIPIEEEKKALVEKAQKWRETLNIIENLVRERKHREELNF